VRVVLRQSVVVDLLRVSARVLQSGLARILAAPGDVAGVLTCVLEDRVGKLSAGERGPVRSFDREAENAIFQEDFVREPLLSCTE